MGPEITGRSSVPAIAIDGVSSGLVRGAATVVEQQCQGSSSEDELTRGERPECAGSVLWTTKR